MLTANITEQIGWKEQLQQK